MRDMDLEHPDITSALRTGYPAYQQEGGRPSCDDCGQEADPEDGTYKWLYELDGDWLCADCLMERIKEMDVRDLADWLGCDVMEVTA